MRNVVFTRALPVLLASVAALIGSASTSAAGTGIATESFGGRDFLVYTPAQLPAPGSRALVVVLHGGLGNANRIEYGQGGEAGLNMDRMADKYGFIVAYLNGTPVTRRMGADKLGWNAGGGCCGLSFERNVDDVGYITSTVAHLQSEYGVARNRVFGMGHSNGAMMAQRMACETNVLSAVVAVSGPVNLSISSCPASKGKRTLAIHGSDDANVPVAGGRGAAQMSDATYNSEERSRQIVTAGGGAYTLKLVQGADHRLEHIDTILQQTDGKSIAETSAQFFGLTGSGQ